MKLIRLTSDNPNGIIETNFNQDIQIEENSKIALLNASFSVSEERFNIDQYNHQVIYYSNASGNEDAKTEIFLDKLDYIKENASELLEDITNKFNDNLKENTQNIGAQVRLSTEGGKTAAQVKISPNNGQLFEDFLNNPNALNTNINTNIIQNNLQMSKDTASSNDDTGACASYFEFGKGYSSLRSRIDLLDKNIADTTVNGFYMGLSTTSPSDWTLTNGEYSDSDKTYYIHIADPSLATHIYTKIDGGAEVASGIQLDRDVNNNVISKANYIQIDKNGKNLEFRLYRESQANADLLLSVPMLDRNIKLYPFFILKGGVNILKLDTVKYTLDPYKTDLRAYLNPLLDDTEYIGLGAVPKQIRSGFRTIKSMIFQSSILANFLGFESNILLNNNNRYAGQFFNKAENQFRILIQNPYFIIKINTINLESFDADSRGRFNIISSFGNEQENSTRSIFYEASNPIFLDIKNSQPRTIRNIRMQILNSDLTNTSTDGFSSITLLID